jgi:hypothetical protein
MKDIAASRLYVVKRCKHRSVLQPRHLLPELALFHRCWRYTISQPDRLCRRQGGESGRSEGQSCAVLGTGDGVGGLGPAAVIGSFVPTGLEQRLQVRFKEKSFYLIYSEDQIHISFLRIIPGEKRAARSLPEGK